MQGQKIDNVVIIGAGPAGLTAGYELSKKNVKCLVLEKSNTVGGISQTASYKNFHFDIGGHRFFTKISAVEELWHEILPAEDFITCNRLSRIYYKKKFFDYPLKAANALFGLGIFNSFLIVLSYIKAQFFPQSPEANFEQWVSNRFGKRLYKIFFKTYTEKVWGIACNEISADWAAQRIKGLSLFTALKNALIQQAGIDKDKVIKTLIDSFQYPRRGPGMMWEKTTERIREMGNTIQLRSQVGKIFWENDRVTSLEVKHNGETRRVFGDHFISTMPIRELIENMVPAVPREVLEAARKLKYRDFLTVALVIDNPDLFPDNWIYIHDSDVKVGRIQNFKNWSQDMVPDQTKTCLGLEYFCFEGDGLWTLPDEELVALGRKEIDLLELASAEDVVDGCVVRMPKAYPVYDSEYKEALKIIKHFIEKIHNLQLVGRNGMHRYNNQDHSMLTAMLAVRNLLGATYDLWKVNDDNNYHEEVTEGETSEFSKDISLLSSTQPRVPKRVVKTDG